VEQLSAVEMRESADFSLICAIDQVLAGMLLKVDECFMEEVRLRQTPFMKVKT